MKTLLCTILLATTFVAGAQFNRSYLNGTPSFNVFSSKVFVNAQQETELVSVVPGTAGQVRILVQDLNAEGEVTGISDKSYTVALPPSSPNIYLEGVAESGNERYYVLSVGAGSNLNVLWIKVNKSTLALTASIVGSEVYKAGFFEAKVVGSQLVTYKVRSTGLYRVSVNTATWNAAVEELVTASITGGVSTINLNAGIRAGALFEIDGNEMVVFGAGAVNASLFKRNSAGNYSTFATGISCGNGMSAFPVSSTEIGISNGTAVEHYNTSGTLTESGTFPVATQSTKNMVSFSNDVYHVFGKASFGGTLTHYSVGADFQAIDSIRGNMSAVYDVVSTSDRSFLIGMGNEKGLQADISGNDAVGRPVYVESFTSDLKLRTEEYTYRLETADLTANVGIGTKLFGEFNNLAAVTYDKRSAVYNLTEQYLAFTNTGDTISNHLSAFNEQNNELPGPYTTSGEYDEILEAKYNRSYYVSVKMIEDHIDSLQSGSLTYVPSFGIKNWPAHGNPAIGQAEDVAPFVDVNGNGTYEPMSGDYPLIYGSECLFSVSHFRTDGNDDKALEFHSYVYVQHCDTSDVFDNVLMRKVRVIARGADLDSIYYAARFDGDLGNYADDYIGTNVDLGLVYNYNGDTNDEDNSGRIGFHDTIPAQGVLVLKGMKQANDGLDNAVGSGNGQSPNGYGFADGTNDNEYYGLQSSQVYSGGGSAVYGDPQSFLTWQNVHKGLFAYGDTVYYGGIGYFPSGYADSLPSRYMYTGEEDAYNYGTYGIDPGYLWTEAEPAGSGSMSSPSGDRRAIIGFGKGSVENGDFIELDYAYVIARGETVTANINEPVELLFSKSQDIRNSFLANEGPCNINFDPIDDDLGIPESVSDEHILVYPNPTTGSVKIAGLVADAAVTIFDLNGRQLKTVNVAGNSEIDLQELNGNVFILSINENGKVYRKRVTRL